jgi:2-iminobutanoate/2-iminopropanoate deaminase
MSRKQPVAHPDNPKTIGPYSPAIKCNGPFLFVSGTIGNDPTTGELVAGGIAAQTKQVGNTVFLS